MTHSPLSRVLGRRLAITVLAFGGLLGSAANPAPARAVVPIVTLTASALVAAPGDLVTLQATSDVELDFIGIFTGIEYVSTCYSTTSCSAVVSSASTETRQYHTFYSQGSFFGFSNPVQVTWANAQVPPCESSSGIMLCVTTGAEIRRVTVFEGATDPGNSHRVVGHVDLYRFVFPTGTVTVLPCVRVSLDGASLNPCQQAGGTYVSTSQTLVDWTVSEREPTTGGAIASAAVCDATLRFTYEGIGIESTPAYTLC